MPTSTYSSKLLSSSVRTVSLISCHPHGWPRLPPIWPPHSRPHELLKLIMSTTPHPLLSLPQLSTKPKPTRAIFLLKEKLYHWFIDNKERYNSGIGKEERKSDVEKAWQRRHGLSIKNVNSSYLYFQLLRKLAQMYNTHNQCLTR